MWAEIRCNIYLLFKGVWRGECMIKTWKRGKLILVGTIDCPIYDFYIYNLSLNESQENIHLKKVFYKI